MTQIKCEIYQHGELYNCGVYAYVDDEEVCLGAIRCDKVKIKYNTNSERFVVSFTFGGMRLVESSVDKIYLYDLEKDNRISLPDIDAEWPYDSIHMEMKEE